MSDGWRSARTMRAWIGYDIASSVYFGVFPALLFPLYFRAYLDGGPAAELHWGLTAAAAFVLAAILAPALGAAADRHAMRWPLLVTLTLLCCAATAGIAQLPGGMAFAGALLFIAAHVGYTLAMSLYDSCLPHVAPAGKAGRISGLGWGLGFLGGIVAIVAVMPLAGGDPGTQAGTDFRWSFVVVAALFFLFAVPALAGLRTLRTLPVAGSALNPFRAAWNTLRGWREQRALFRFLLAYYLINDGIVTVLFFAALYLRTSFGVSVADLLWLALLYHLIALPATIAFGWLADRWTHRKAIFLSLGIWIGAILLMALGTADWVPGTVVALLALVLGSTQSLLRSEYARLVPPLRSAEFFGFNTLAGRLSAALGPLVFGVVANATGSQRFALLSVLLFLLGGAAVLVRCQPPAPSGA
jgi:UMF1 family MFS transporter